MAKKKIAFVSSPFGWDYENVKNAVAYSKALQKKIGKEYVLITPHILFSQFMTKDQEQEGIDACETLVHICDLLIVCGETVSPGMELEIKKAKELDKEILYFVDWTKKMSKSGTDKFEELLDRLLELPQKDLIKLFERMQKESQWKNDIDEWGIVIAPEVDKENDK